MGYRVEGATADPWDPARLQAYVRKVRETRRIEWADWSDPAKREALIAAVQRGDLNPNGLHARESVLDWLRPYAGQKVKRRPERWERRIRRKARRRAAAE